MRGLFGLGALVLSLLAPPALAAGTERQPAAAPIPRKESSPVESLEVQLGASSTALSKEAAESELRTAEPYDVVATFEDRQVWKLVTARASQFFRVHGVGSNPGSAWFACCETLVNGTRYVDASGRALPPWNAQTGLTTVFVPPGTTLYVGRAADMTYTPKGQCPVVARGGALQIFSPELAARVAAAAVVLHEYRRRPLEGSVVPATSSDEQPRAPIEVRLGVPPQPIDGCFKALEPVNVPSTPPAQPASPARDELVQPAYWFDQISAWVRSAASRPS